MLHRRGNLYALFIFPDFYVAVVHSLVEATPSLGSAYLCMASSAWKGHSLYTGQLHCRISNCSVLVLVNLDLGMSCSSVPELLIATLTVLALPTVLKAKCSFWSLHVRPDLPFLNAQRTWHQHCATLISARVLCLLGLSWVKCNFPAVCVCVKIPRKKKSLDWHDKFPLTEKT